MKLPFRMLLLIVRGGVQSHRIRKWSVKDLVVGRGDGLQYFRKLQLLCDSHVLQPRYMSAWENHDFERPNSPVRDQRYKPCILPHDTFSTSHFHREIGAQ